MFRNAGGAGARGMNAVRLVQIRHARNPLEQEWDEGHLVLAGEIMKDLTKCGRVLFTVIRGRLHADEQHGHCPAAAPCG